MTQTTWLLPTRKDSRSAIIPRIIGFLFAVAIAVFYSDMNAARWLLVFFAVVLNIIVAFLAPRSSSKKMVYMYMWNGLFLELLAVLIVPEIWFFISLFLVATITTGIYGNPSRTSKISGFLGATFFGGLGFYHGIDSWVRDTVVIFLITLITISTNKLVTSLQRNQEVRLSQLSSVSEVVVWEIDRDSGKMRAVSGATQRIAGLSPSEWASMDASEMVHPDDFEGFRTIGEGKKEVIWEGRIRNKDQWCWVRETYTDSRNADNIRTFQGSTVDIDSLTRANRNLEKVSRIATHRSNHNQLTDLPNRNSLISQAEQESCSLTLFLVDVREIGRISEALGYETADNYLQIMGNRLKQHANRSGALAAHTESSEFAVLYKKNLDPGEIETTAKTIIRVCSEAMTFNGLTAKTEVVVGVAVSTSEDINPDVLLRKAKSATHDMNGQKWKIAKPNDLSEITERFELARQVGKAIADRQLELWFQPKNSLETNKIIGFEGLIRWNHPEYEKVLSPWKFLDVIDFSGSADDFDRYVILETVEFASRCWHSGRQVPVSVNVPGRALQQESLVTYIEQLLEMWKLPPEAITLELTEDAFSGEIESLKPVMEKLSSLGCGISIDDFGTGHSSLTRLKMLPVTEIKIDKSFVMKLSEDPENEIIVRSTIQLAEMMGLDCVAEGVETEEIRQKLLELGCVKAQGFHYSQPVPVANALEMIQKIRETI